jgi:pimeloyl-ACP methyl ester carboxylesterase
MATFVLVHGAMHGGWSWRDVRRRLRAAGHDVHTPTLTGQGDRRGSLTRDVGLSTHVVDLTELLWFEDLADVHLVLHSYAGALAGPVAEQRGDRLASVVYLGAFVTRPGQSLLDVEPPAVGERYLELARTSGDGWYVPASDRFLDQWGVTDGRLRSLVGARLTDFPLRCVTEPSVYDPSALDALRKVYVRHTEPPLASLEASADVALGAGWEFHDVPCGHDMMLEAPGTVADLLETVAAGTVATGAMATAGGPGGVPDPRCAPPVRRRRAGAPSPTR